MPLDLTCAAWTRSLARLLFVMKEYKGTEELFFCFSGHFSFIGRKVMVTNLAFPEKKHLWKNKA